MTRWTACPSLVTLLCSWVVALNRRLWVVVRTRLASLRIRLVRLDAGSVVRLWLGCCGIGEACPELKWFIMLRALVLL